MGIFQNVAIGGGAIAAIVITFVIFRNQISGAFTQFGSSVGGAFTGAAAGFVGAFEGLEFPSFDFGNGDNGDGSGASELAGETVPFGTEGGTVTIPEDTFVNPDGTVSSDTPPTATDPELTSIQQFTLARKGIFERVAEIFSFGSVDTAIETAIDEPNVTNLPAAEDFRQATEALLASLENPDIVGDEPVAFFNVFEDVGALPLSQFALDFFENIDVETEFAFSVPSFARFNSGGA